MISKKYTKKNCTVLNYIESAIPGCFSISAFVSLIGISIRITISAEGLKTESKPPKVIRTNKRNPVLLSKCAACSSRKLRFIKEQEASVLLSNFGMRKPLSDIAVLVDILF